MKKVIVMAAVAMSLTACTKTTSFSGNISQSTAATPVPVPTVTQTVTVTAPPPMNIVCSVYDLSQDGLGNGDVPDFETLTPVASITLGTINAPVESVTQQFQLFPASVAAELPGAYGLDCNGNLMITTAGTYNFSLNSDDGSELFIDGTLIINNPGPHAMEDVTGSANLTAGSHKIRVVNSQNDQGQQGLELAYELPGDNYYQIIPAANFCN
jgi:hypothetical protein